MSERLLSTLSGSRVRRGADSDADLDAREALQGDTGLVQHLLDGLLVVERVRLAEVVESERRIAEETTRAEGKPEAAIGKIVEGRLNGFFKDATLLGQPYALDNKKSVQKVLDEAGVTLKRFSRIKVGI